MFTNTFDNNVTMKGRMISLPLDLQRAFVLLMETIEEARLYISYCVPVVISPSLVSHPVRLENDDLHRGW